MRLKRSTVLALTGLSALLAACGNNGTAPAAGLSLAAPRTEFRTQTGVYVACNDVAQLSGPHTTQTAFALRFALPSPPQRVTLALKGTTTSQYDAFYTQTLSGDQLTRFGKGTLDQRPGRYKVTLSASATSALYLSQAPATQALSVTLARQKVKIKLVQPSGFQSGGVTAQVSAQDVQSGTVTATAATSIPVYDHCTVVADSGDTL